MEASSSFGGPSLWVEVGRSSLVMAREEVRAGGDVSKLARWKKSVGQTRKPRGRRCGPAGLGYCLYPGLELKITKFGLEVAGEAMWVEADIGSPTW